MSEKEKNENQEQETQNAQEQQSENTQEKQEKQSEKKQEETVSAKTDVAEAQPSREDFNWDAFISGDSEYSDQEQKEFEQMYENTLSDVDEAETVKAKVVGITDNDVVLNIGYKSDGLVPLSEFKNNPDLKVGDEVEVLIEKKEDDDGQIRLSHRKAVAEKAWDIIVDAHENDKILKGYIKDRTKGGMVVDLMGMDSFLPGSQIDIKPIKDYDAYVGQTMDLKVVKLNLEYRNIVVSHKAIIESDLEQQKTEILSKLEKGQVLEGVVKNLTSFGVFVDLGGVDGLIHITDVSWGRISHPEELLEMGQKINVVVLDYDEEKKRISLGMKQLTSHPWETLPEDIVEGSEIEGKVVNIEDYGAFIEIQPGVEGLVHVSEMSWSQHLKSPEEYVNLGDKVKTKVLSIDREERKLSLGMKQLTSDPWEGIEEKFPVGTKHTALVRSITNFGLFMELEEGVDGLVHVSDLSWTKKFAHPNEFTKVGEKLDVIVLEVDKENRRLSLGHKQIEDDPWDTFESVFLQDSIHEATVIKVEDKGAIVVLPYGVEAFAPNKHLMKKDKARVAVEDVLEFKILEFDKDNRRIIVSHTDIWKEEERAQKRKESEEAGEEVEQTKKDVKKVKSKVDSSTLAEEHDGLAALKQKMESSEKEKQSKAIKKLKEEEVEEKPKAKAKTAKAKAEEDVAEEDKKETKKKATTAKKKTTATAKKDEKEAEATEEKKTKKTTAKKAATKSTTAKKATKSTKKKDDEDKKEDKS